LKIDNELKEYVYYLGTKISNLQNKVSELEKFKSDFAQKKSYKKQV